MATWSTETGFEGDLGQCPVKNRVWVNLPNAFQLKVKVKTGEVRVTVKQRDGWRIGYRTKMDSDYGVQGVDKVGSWVGPWSFPPKRNKADFKVTMETRKRDTTFDYSYYV